MGFKGKTMPSWMVKQASGVECLAFQPKQKDTDKK